jgi:RNA polymerase-binding transcription factor DksA
MTTTPDRSEREQPQEMAAKIRDLANEHAIARCQRVSRALPFDKATKAVNKTERALHEAIDRLFSLAARRASPPAGEAMRCIKPQCPPDCSMCDHAIPGDNEALVLIADMLNHFAVDGHGGPLEDGESAMADRARAFLCRAQPETMWLLEWGAISLPMGHESRITCTEVHPTKEAAERAAEGLEFDHRIVPDHAERRQTLIDALVASKSWMRGYAEAFVDDMLHVSGVAPAAASTAIPNADPADIIAGELQTSLAHAYELMADALMARYDPTVEDAMQRWAGMDGTTAHLLIERHADNWSDVGKMMDEWLAANCAREPAIASLQAELSQMRSGIAALLKVRDGYGWCKESDDAIEALRGLVPPKAHE